ncbi:MAG: Protoheme farnesyltransferase [Candidatus Saccharibacteria bacterium]|nr:Protoheme farnesyltransferase [Candidatus Saccharibacteria bacterium]
MATILGLSLVIGSACVFNNYIDRDIDALMARTKKRALTAGTVSGSSALVYASVLVLLGLGLLVAYANLLTAFIALFGFFAYVIIYGAAKRRSVHGTVVGSISGAVPPVVGYCAVTGRLDAGALILFLILVCWQMPHFYAIAMYRHDDYAAAKIPVLPVSKGMGAAKVQIMAYIAAFIIAAAALTAFDYTGYIYLTVVLLLGFAWLWFGGTGFKTDDDKQWGRKMFLYSLIVITLLSITIIIDSMLTTGSV